MRRIKTLIKELFDIECELWEHEPKEIVKAIDELEKEEKYRTSTLLEVVYTRYADLIDNE